MREVNIYIYTTVRSPRKKHGAYTYLLETGTAKGSVTRSDTRRLEDVTAHKAQLLALSAAIKRLNKNCELVIYMDSAYIEACTGKWLERWRMSGWENAKGKPVADMEEWKELACLLDSHRYRFVIGEKHSYYGWMKAESERAEKDVRCRLHN